jgi:hypothetical protein
MVYGLMGPDAYVEDQASMSRIAVNFYKNLFAAEEIDDISLCHDFWEEGDLVTHSGRKGVVRCPLFRGGD